jgi:hypothetical protein
MKFTFDYINSKLRYDPKTGLLFWKIYKSGKYLNTPAGTLFKSGYIMIKHKNCFLRAHRIAWLLTTSKWPLKDIDHINGNRSDNRLTNLREASKSQNAQNSKIRKDSRSGITGVYIHKGIKNNWRVRITINSKTKNLGYFNVLEKAKKVRQQAEKKLFGNFAPTKIKNEKQN